MVSQGTLPPKLRQQVHLHLAVPVGAAGDSASLSLPLVSQEGPTHPRLTPENILFFIPVATSPK